MEGRLLWFENDIILGVFFIEGQNSQTQRLLSCAYYDDKERAEVANFCFYLLSPFCGRFYVLFSYWKTDEEDICRRPAT